MNTTNLPPNSISELTKKYWHFIIPVSLGLILTLGALGWWVCEIWTRSVGPGHTSWSQSLPSVPEQKP